MSEENDDKQFDPSESKLRKARQEGDVPRSTELHSALMYLGFWFAIMFGVTWAVPDWVGMAARLIGGEPWPDATGRSVTCRWVTPKSLPGLPLSSGRLRLQESCRGKTLCS